jgi:tape measure domain-containing protein
MARYSIDFSTNASRVTQEIEGVNKAIAKTLRLGKNEIELDLDASKLSQSISATFKQLDKEIARYQRQLRKLDIGSAGFTGRARLIGERQGVRERGALQAQAASLRGQAFAFESGSALALQKALQGLQIEASQIAPNTKEWIDLQRRIAAINFDLQKSQSLAESVQLRENLGAFAPGSLNALEARLTILRNRAREIAPSTPEWKKLNQELVKTEKLIERQTRRPLTGGQRMGAAGGAFLYGGGMGGGIGSALGGVAGGLMGGVPGAFTGAALGQMADNLGMMVASVTKGAASIAQLQRGLALASIDAKDFGEAQEAIRQSSDRLIVPIERVYRQFTQLRVNTKQYGLTVKDTQQILEGVVLAVSSTGGSLEDVDGAMRAVIQIFSKGSVQAEELRGQLGERFPGAVVKFAQANKMSFAELQSSLEQGKVTVADFVNFAKKNYEDYAKFADQLATAPEFAGRRLEKAMNDMQLAIGSALGPAGAVFQDFFTETIKGFTKWVNDNKDFIAQYLKDWATFATDFARIVGKIAGVVIRVSTTIIKAFRGAIMEIRRLLGMVGVAEIKAELDRVNAKIALGQSGGRRGAAQSGLEARRRQLQAQFEAAGGQAALDAAARGPSDLVFGGPGAGVDLNQVTGGKKAKDKATKELRDYTSDRVNILQREMAAKLAAIDADESIFARERELQAARVKLQYQGMILQEQARLAQEESLKFSAGSRALFLQERKAEFDQEALRVQSEYAKTIKGPLLSALEQYNNSLDDEAKKLELTALGRERLTHVEEAEALIRDALAKATDDERKMAEGLITTLRNLALARESAFSGQYLVNIQNALRDARELVRAPLGMEGLVARRQELRRQGIGEGQAQALFDYEQETERLGRLKEGFAGLASEVNAGFGTAITNIATDFENLQQHGLSFIQTMANAFKSLANTIIQEMTRAMINKAVSSLFSFAMPGLSSSAVVQGVDVPVSQMPAGMAFANGGMVTGPTLGLIGEGRFNEAVVPLPNGKSIPVDLGGAAGSNISTNIVVNMNNGQASSQMTGSGGQALGRELEGAVRNVILKESRPGGLIYSNR